MFMHVGFSLVETGTCRARNASDLLIKNVSSLGSSGEIVEALLSVCAKMFKDVPSASCLDISSLGFFHVACDISILWAC